MTDPAQVRKVRDEYEPLNSSSKQDYTYTLTSTNKYEPAKYFNYSPHDLISKQKDLDNSISGKSQAKSMSYKPNRNRSKSKSKNKKKGDFIKVGMTALDY